MKALPIIWLTIVFGYGALAFGFWADWRVGVAFILQSLSIGLGIALGLCFSKLKWTDDDDQPS